jgi:hypothetical protein
MSLAIFIIARRAAAICVPDLEAIAGIQSEMPDAAGQAIEEGDRPAEQQQHANRRGDERLCRPEHLAAGGHRDQPPGQQDGAQSQRNPSESVQD